MQIIKNDFKSVLYKCRTKETAKKRNAKKKIINGQLLVTKKRLGYKTLQKN